MTSNYLLTPWLIELEGSMRHSQGLPIIPILRRTNPIPPIDTFILKIHYNIVLPSTASLPKDLLPVGLLVEILKELFMILLLVLLALRPRKPTITGGHDVLTTCHS